MLSSGLDSDYNHMEFNNLQYNHYFQVQFINVNCSIVEYDI